MREFGTMRQFLGGKSMKVLIFTVALLTLLQANASTSVLEVAPDTDRNFFVNGFSLATLKGEALQRGGGRLGTYNYASLNYRTGPLTHIALRLPFVYNSAGFEDSTRQEDLLNNQEQTIDLGDVLLDYTLASTLLPGEIEMFSRVRLELPTSKYSIAQKKIAGIKGDFIMSRFVAPRMELEYWPTFTWNIHTQTVYINPDFDSISHTKIYELNQRLTLWYKAHQKLSVGFFAGAEDEWFNASKQNNTGRQRGNRLGEHKLKLGPAVRYTLGRNLTFLFNLSNTVPMWGFTPDRAGQYNDLGRFRPEQTELVLLSFLNF